ncbi:hypothetical protein Sjap_006009 [Stephania japonica]|uniref:Uncharacterized protein n=1 Tax=Stephania japonica TaxID=461633 RepID=A0AAP0K590_9MAGN
MNTANKLNSSLVTMKTDFCSPSSSPPTPPSPLPVSIGPGYQKYLFSSSPSPSPPFSPPSSCASHEEIPLLSKKFSGPLRMSSSFNLDHGTSKSGSQISCVKDLLEKLVQRICCCCTKSQ